MKDGVLLATAHALMNRSFVGQVILGKCIRTQAEMYHQGVTRMCFYGNESVETLPQSLDWHVLLLPRDIQRPSISSNYNFIVVPLNQV